MQCSVFYGKRIDKYCVAVGNTRGQPTCQLFLLMQPQLCLHCCASSWVQRSLRLSVTRWACSEKYIAQGGCTVGGQRLHLLAISVIKWQQGVTSCVCVCLSLSACMCVRVPVSACVCGTCAPLVVKCCTFLQCVLELCKLNRKSAFKMF